MSFFIRHFESFALVVSGMTLANGVITGNAAVIHDDAAVVNDDAVVINANVAVIDGDDTVVTMTMPF
jgi:hypothetical protein